MRASSLLVALSLCAYPRFAHAQADPVAATDAKVEARRYFQAGVAFQKTDDFQAARDAYTTSLDLYPTKSALFNLANCQRAMHLYADAWQSLRRLQEQFGAELEEPMLSTSRTQLEELENLTGLLTVETVPSGATIAVDGKAVGTTPFVAPVRVAIGQHTVVASLEGHIVKDSGLKLSPKQTLTVALELVAAPEASVQPQAVEPPPAEPQAVPKAKPAKDLAAAPEPQPSGAWKTVGWIGVALGAVGVAAGARVGVLALGVDEHLSNVCAGGHCTQKHASDVERLERLTWSANAFIGAGVVLAAAGATLVLWPATSTTSEQVTLTVGPTALSVKGQF